jgi:hypothetical protein
MLTCCKVEATQERTLEAIGAWLARYDYETWAGGTPQPVPHFSATL